MVPDGAWMRVKPWKDGEEVRIVMVDGLVSLVDVPGITLSLCSTQDSWDEIVEDARAWLRDRIDWEIKDLEHGKEYFSDWTEMEEDQLRQLKRMRGDKDG